MCGAAEQGFVGRGLSQGVGPGLAADFCQPLLGSAQRPERIMESASRRQFVRSWWRHVDQQPPSQI